jgi:Mce-associated membrane protein
MAGTPRVSTEIAVAGEEFGSAVRSDVPSGGAASPPDAGGSAGTGALRRPGGSVGADAYVGDAGNLGADAYLDDEIDAGDHADPARDAAPGRTAVIPRQRPRPHRRVRPAPGASPGSATGSRPATVGTGRAKVTAAEAATAAARGAGGNEDAQPSPGTPAGPAPSRFRLLAGGLAVLLIAALVAAGLLGRSWYDQRQLDGARDGALAAARQTTVNFVSISAATVDRDLKRISDGATGQFKDEFAQDTAQVRAAVMTNKVDSRGTILRAAVVSANLRSAVVLVAIDATVKNTSAPDGRLSHYRIQVNLSRDASGRWLVSQLQFVG